MTTYMIPDKELQVEYQSQNKIKINIYLQAIAISATLCKMVTICSLCIPPHNPINENELTNLIEQLPKPSILIHLDGRF